MSLKVELKNIGGLYAKTLSLERGINRVRAPNAVGKTSFTKALELLVLTEEELRGKGHYSNLFVGSEQPINIKLTGDISHERNFRRIGDEDLKEVGGTTSLVRTDGERVIKVCFAVPGNSLIEDFLAGKKIKDLIDLLAGSENYEKAQAVLRENTEEITSKIQHYRDILIRLEEHTNQKKEEEKELEKLREKFAKSPIFDEKEIFEDYGLFNKKKQELDNLDEYIAEIAGKIQDLVEIIESTKDCIKRYESQIQIIKTKHPRINARLSDIAKEIPVKRKDLDKIKSQKAKADDKLSSAQRNDIILRKYGDGDECYACGKKITRVELHSWINKIKGELSDLSSMQTKLKREIEDLDTEQRELKTEKQDLATFEDDLKKNQKSLANREDDKAKMKQILKDKENKQNTLLHEIKELSKSEGAYNKFKERQEMKVGIDQKEADIKRAIQKIQELKKQTLGVENLENKYDFIQIVRNHLESRKNQITEEIRKKFNEQVTELYKRLGFRDFDDIEIGPDFRISVTREKGGKIIENFPLEALSTSERVTIAIAFLLSAKNEYIRDFPFFILDELITSYDPKRFEIVKDYLKKSEDYIIITELGKDTHEMEIIHGA